MQLPPVVSCWHPRQAGAAASPCRMPSAPPPTASMLQGLTRMAPLREGEQPTNSDTTSMLCRFSGSIMLQGAGWGWGQTGGRACAWQVSLSLGTEDRLWGCFSARYAGCGHRGDHRRGMPPAACRRPAAGPTQQHAGQRSPAAAAAGAAAAGGGPLPAHHVLVGGEVHAVARRRHHHHVCRRGGPSRQRLACSEEAGHGLPQGQGGRWPRRRGGALGAACRPARTAGRLPPLTNRSVQQVVAQPAAAAPPPPPPPPLPHPPHPPAME